MTGIEIVFRNIETLGQLPLSDVSMTLREDCSFKQRYIPSSMFASVEV